MFENPTFRKFIHTEGEHTSHIWIVEGESGAITLAANVFDDAGMVRWFSPSEDFGIVPIDGAWLMAMDLGTHARAPQYEGQMVMEDCLFLGQTCYYDGTSLGAQELLKNWKDSGYQDEVIEATLRAIYTARFDIGAPPLTFEEET